MSAPDPGTRAPAPAGAPKAADGDLFWRVLAAMMFFAVVWVLWVLWQLSPRSVVNDLVYQGAVSRSSKGTIAPAPAAPGASLVAPPGPAGAEPRENLFKLDTKLGATAPASPPGPASGPMSGPAKN